MIAGLRCNYPKDGFLGIEIDQHWFDVSCRKIEAELSAREAGEDMMEALGLA